MNECLCDRSPLALIEKIAASLFPPALRFRSVFHPRSAAEIETSGNLMALDQENKEDVAELPSQVQAV